MKVEYKGTEHTVRLKTLFVNYNCSVKMVGRLTLEGAPKEEVYAHAWRDALDKHKKEIIHEWIGSLDKKETFPPLKEGNPIFPTDTGTYLPSVLLFSDAVNGYAGAHWSQSFMALLREIKDGPYGCLVFDLPAYHNRTYGIYGAPRLSRVWALYPPSMRSMIFTPNNPELNPRFKDKENAKIFEGKEREDLLAAIG